MPPIEQPIKVTGADEAKREADKVSEGLEGVGDAAQSAGKKSEDSGKGVGTFTSLANEAGDALQKWAGGFSALAALKQVVDQLNQSMEEALRLQAELAGTAVDLAGQSKTFGAQIGVGEDESVRILTQLRKAGGLDLQTANELGIAADVAFANQGGILAGQNFATTKEIAAFTGARRFNATDSASLFTFLNKAGALSSPEAAKEATAQIAAAAGASDAQSVGAFVNQLARGGTALLQQGVSFEDVLEAGGQARATEVNEELAAQTLIALERVANNISPEFAAEIERVAKDRGLDAGSLTTAQRVGISRDIFAGIDGQAEQDRVSALLPAEIGGRLIKAFRGSNLEATSAVGDAIDTATIADFERVVTANRDELVFRRNVNDADIDFQKFIAGQSTFTISEARRLAESKLDAEIAQGVVTGVTDSSREAEIERSIPDLFRRDIADLRRRGADVELAQQALDDLGFFDRFTGFSDSRLNQVATEIDAAGRNLRLDNQAKNQTNITVVGTQYNDVEAGRNPPEVLDLND